MMMYVIIAVAAWYVSAYVRCLHVSDWSRFYPTKDKTNGA